jgi:HK97 family phage major capsid protein
MTTPALTPALQPTPDEKRNIELAAMAATIAAVRDKARTDYQATFQAEVERQLALQPDRTVLGQVAGTVPALAGARIRTPYSHLYERMSSEKRAYRSEDADHYMAQWLRAIVAKNEGLRLEAEAKFLELGYARANTLEGLASGTSGMTAGTGASLLPTPIAGVIMVELNRAARLRPVVGLFQSAGKTLRVPRSNKATTQMIAEATAITQGEPTTIDHVLLDKKKASAYFQFSREMLSDAAFSIVNFFSERAGASLGELEDTQICTSNGTAPNITSAIITGITDIAEATSTVLTYADVLKLFFALPEPYQGGAVWLGDPTVMQILSTVRDLNGRPIFNTANDPGNVVGNVAGNIGMIFGRPVYNVPLAAGTLYCGNPQRAYGFLTDVTLEGSVSDQFLFSSDMIAMKVISRFDGNVLTVDAARKMTGLTSAG